MFLCPTDSEITATDTPLVYREGFLIVIKYIQSYIGK